MSMSTPMSSLKPIRQIVSVCQAVTRRSLGDEIGFFFSQRAPWLCYLHFSNTTMVLRCAIQCFIVQHMNDLYFCKVNLCREFFWIFLQVLAKVEKVKAFMKKVRALLNLIFQRMIFSNFNKIFWARSKLFLWNRICSRIWRICQIRSQMSSCFLLSINKQL